MQGLRCTIVVFLLILASAAAAADLWYEDNNLGRAAGMPGDFIEKFSQPETFKEATRHIRVYMVRSNVLAQLDDRFLATRFLPYLKAHRIGLAIDTGGATWAQAHGRERVFAADIDLLRRLKRLGAEVGHVSLQSVLSKPRREGGKQVDYPMSKRVEDATAYAKAAREVYPAAAIGIIDALPAHGEDYRQPYRALKDALAGAGIALAYVHLDMPFDLVREGRRGGSWQGLLQIEHYVAKDLGASFGWIVTSRRGGRTSARAWHEDVMAALDCYAGVGGSPAQYIVSSWFRYPDTTIPDNATGAHYPAMRTVLAFGRRLDELDRVRAGPRPATARAACSGKSR